MGRKSYAEKLRDPRWQKKRLEILERDEWRCEMCWNDKATLNVHHRYYQGEPWEAPDDALVTLCENCHKSETKDRKKAEKRLLKVTRRLLWSGSVDTLCDVLEAMAERDQAENEGDHIIGLSLCALRHFARMPSSFEWIVKTWHRSSYRRVVKRMET